MGVWIAKLLNHGADPIALARLRCGSRVYVDLRCPDHWGAFVLHTYDSGLVCSIRDALDQPGCVFMDIGASVGLISMSLVPHIEAKDGCIVAYEPYEGNRNLFLRSLSRNNVEGLVDVYPVALGARSGKVLMAISEVSADAGNALVADGISPDVLPVMDGACTAKLMKLDDHIMEIGLERLDCIKLDVEGLELDVIAGAPVQLFIERIEPWCCLLPIIKCYLQGR